jgi:tetratricopeptide (TPR) repeat protein
MRWCRSIVIFVMLCLAGQSHTQNGVPGALAERIKQADALQEKGALSEARAIYESVLTTLRSNGPSAQLGYVFNSLSELASAEGKYDEAISWAEQAADVYGRIGDRGGESHALNYRGIAEVQRGFYAKAHTTLNEALALSRTTGDLESQVRILNNVGTSDYYPGNYLRALRTYESALEIVERSAGLVWSGYWRQITEINQATIYQRLGQYQQALEIYQRVESSSKRLTASDRAHLLTNLGALYRRLGDAWKALDRYRSALDLYAKQHDADGEISTLKNIGIVYALDQEDLKQAQSFFQRALRLAIQSHNQREEMQGHLYLGETFLRKGIISSSAQEFRLALTQARQLGTTEEQWKALYGAGRTEELSGDAAKAESDYREAVSIIEASRSQLQLSALRTEFLADKRDVFDALIPLLLAKSDISEAFRFLEKSRSRILQDRLASGNSPGQTQTEPASLSEIRGYLDDSTILLEFWASGDRLALIWCARDGYGAIQNRLSSEDLRELRSFLQGLPGNLGDDWRQQAGILGRLVPASLPLASHLRRAFIVPDGWLTFVPFDLLPVSASADSLLIERLDIAYLPTAAFLRRVTGGDRNMRFPWMRELVAFGDPVVRGEPTGADGLERGTMDQALLYSGDEVRNIAAMSAGQAVLLLGPDDSRTAFLADTARGAPILHVSTHAFADADNPENSRILFSPETAGGAPDYVFLRELYALDLNGIELATLSACSTEKGKLIRGEGLQAFSRAFLSAGALSTVTTLWRVDDQPTNQFMKQLYYFALEKHQTKAEALRSAKLKFLSSGGRLANPAHWAGFVLNGDGYHPLPTFISWRQLAAAMAGLMLAVVASLYALLGRGRRLQRVNRS